jgi:MYXO-CTERM domain-containing protein
MSRSLCAFAAVFCVTSAAWAGSLPATLTAGTKYSGISIDNHGEARTYDVYVGKSWSASGPKAPIIFERLLGQTAGLQAEVDARGYLWVSPYGVPPDDRFLYYVNEYPGTYLEIQHSPPQEVMLTHGDDWGYFGAVIDELSAKAHGDATRTFFTGLSAGGLLTYNTAGHMAHRFAAVAPVAGAFVWNNIASLGPQLPPNADCPLSVIHFHGDQDQAVAYSGVVGTNVTIWSAHQSSGYWVTKAECDPTPKVDTTTIPGAKIESWTGCAGGREVRLITQLGAGHVMPPYAMKPMFDFFADKTTCSTAEVQTDAGAGGSLGAGGSTGAGGAAATGGSSGGGGSTGASGKAGAGGAIGTGAGGGAAMGGRSGTAGGTTAAGASGSDVDAGAAVDDAALPADANGCACRASRGGASPWGFAMAAMAVLCASRRRHPRSMAR